VQLKQVVIATAVGVGLLGLGFWIGGATAGTTEPGTAADPLISKSYVDSMLAFQVVPVPKDSSLVGEGGTEIVLRAGQGAAVASANGGLLDVTEGVDLSQGATVKLNHLLVVPRTDGRGVTAKTDAIFMVKGVYTIRPASK